MESGPRVLVGTSGFSYDEWVGPWYPRGTRREAMLEAYAETFPALEINASYYGTPPPSTAESIVRRAAGRLEFVVKAPGDLTHRRRLDADTILPWRRFLEPFQDGNKLLAVLLQFPAAFRYAPEPWEFLRRVRRELAGLPLALEFRHRSWDRAEVDERLAAASSTRVIVDQPALEDLAESGRIAVTAPLAYVRFHGRNAAAWYTRDAAGNTARYRYDYSRAELTSLAPLVREAAAKAETTIAFFNNHPDGAAPRNAVDLAELLDAPIGPRPKENDLLGEV